MFSNVCLPYLEKAFLHVFLGESHTVSTWIFEQLHPMIVSCYGQEFLKALDEKGVVITF